MTTTDTDVHGKQNATAWYDNIREMVAALDAGEDDEQETARERITESVLSVEVRDGWRVPGERLRDDGAPEEYSILLTTGGPALRLYGRLGRYSEPDDEPILQWQDWGTPWTNWWPEDAEGYRDTLRTFAAQFYFGE